VRGEGIRDGVIEHLSADAKDDQMVTSACHVGYDMGGEHDRPAVFSNIGNQDIEEFPTRERIEAGQRLI
jgi:hypothetical protein